MITMAFGLVSYVRKMLFQEYISMGWLEMGLSHQKTDSRFTIDIEPIR